MRLRLFSVCALPIWVASAVGCSFPEYRLDVPGVFHEQEEGPDGLVVIEAEDYIQNVPMNGTSWTLVTEGADFSGDGAMQALPDRGRDQDHNYAALAPRLDYRVVFSRSGRHYLWLRGLGVDDPGNSCHAGMDGREISTANRISFDLGLAWLSQAENEVISIDVPEVGPHILNLWMREDGVVVDKLVLTTNPDFFPTGDGPVQTK